MLRAWRAALALLALLLPAPVAMGAASELKNGYFDPAVLEATPGEAIVWRNTDDRAHTVTSTWDEGATFNAIVKPGESFTWTFMEGGEYPVHCIPHVYPSEEGGLEGMTQTVLVGAAPEPAPKAEAPGLGALALTGVGGLACALARRWTRRPRS